MGIVCHPIYKVVIILITLRHSRLQLQTVPFADLVFQYIVHQPVLLDHRQSFEPGALDVDAEHGPTPSADVSHFQLFWLEFFLQYLVYLGLVLVHRGLQSLEHCRTCRMTE